MGVSTATAPFALSDGSITAAKLANDSVTPSKVSDDKYYLEMFYSAAIDAQMWVAVESTGTADIVATELVIVTSATANKFARIASTGTLNPTDLGGTLIMEYTKKMSANPTGNQYSDAVPNDTNGALVGFKDATWTNYAFLSYDESTENWEFRTADGVEEKATPVEIDWTSVHKVRIEIDATSSRCYLDDVLIATNSTNPAGVDIDYFVWAGDMAGGGGGVSFTCTYNYIKVWGV